MKKFTKCLFLGAFIFFSFNLSSKFVSADTDHWYRVWGGSGHDECIGIALDSSNNIYLGGVIEISNEVMQYSALCLVKFDNSGTCQWNKTINGTSYRGGDIWIDSSDNIFLTGEIYNTTSSTFDFIVIKYDALGNYLWNATWDSGKDDVCYTVALDSLGNIYLAGSTFTEPNNEDFCLVKFDNLGNFLWNRTWGGTGTDIYWSIAIDPSNNIFLGGDKGDGSMCLVKYNSTGDFQWYRTWPNSDFCRAVALDSLENIFIAGMRYTPDRPDFVLVKYDKVGNYKWNRTWGSEDSFEECYSMMIDSSDNLYLVGNKDEQLCMVRYDTNGTLQWSRFLKIDKGGFATGIVKDTSGNFYIGGNIFSNSGLRDFVLVKNLNLFPQQEIAGYNIFLFTIIIGILAFVIILKTTRLYNKKKKIKRI
jgi:hypothetical protein